MTRLLPLLLALSACAGVPPEHRLYGFWANLEMGTVRAFEFAESSADPVMAGQEGDVFTMYLYTGGRPPVPVQKGGFRTERAPVASAGGDMAPALVTEIWWADDPSLVGQTFANEVLAHEKLELVLFSETAFENERVYRWVEALP